MEMSTSRSPQTRSPSPLLVDALAEDESEDEQQAHESSARMELADQRPAIRCNPFSIDYILSNAARQQRQEPGVKLERCSFEQQRGPSNEPNKSILERKTAPIESKTTSKTGTAPRNSLVEHLNQLQASQAGSYDDGTNQKAIMMRRQRAQPEPFGQMIANETVAKHRTQSHLDEPSVASTSPNFFYFMACMLLQQQHQQQQHQHQQQQQQLAFVRHHHQQQQQQQQQQSLNGPSSLSGRLHAPQIIQATPMTIPQSNSSQQERSPIDSLALLARLTESNGCGQLQKRQRTSSNSQAYIPAHIRRQQQQQPHPHHQPYPGQQQAHSSLPPQAIHLFNPNQQQLLGNGAFDSHSLAANQMVSRVQQQQQLLVPRQLVAPPKSACKTNSTSGPGMLAPPAPMHQHPKRPGPQIRGPPGDRFGDSSPTPPAANGLSGNGALGSNSCDKLDNLKPAHSYIGLIGMCILSSPEKRMVLNDIYQYILDHYPYYRNRGSGWRNSVRHNLSLNECFQKAGRAANGKGHYWTIHPANMEDFMNGDFRRRRAQRKVRRWNNMDVPSDESDDESMEDATRPPLPEHFKRSIEMHKQLELELRQHQQAGIVASGTPAAVHFGGPIGPLVQVSGPAADTRCKQESSVESEFVARVAAIAAAAAARDQQHASLNLDLCQQPARPLTTTPSPPRTQHHPKPSHKHQHRICPSPISQFSGSSHQRQNNI